MNIFQARMLCVCGLALGLVHVPDTLANEPVSGSPLTLRDAVQWSLGRNPDLKTFAFSLRAQDARHQQADMRPAPELSAELENAFGSGNFNGTDAADLTFAVSQVIELGDKRQRRADAALIGREIITVEEQAAQLDVLAEVTRRFVHVASDQKQLALTQQATELTRNTVEAVEKRVEAAKSPDVELFRARAALTRAEIDLQHAQHELRASRRKLAAMWGAQEAEFGPVESDLYQMAAPAAFEVLVTRMRANPDFARFASEARLRDAEIRLAEAKHRPDIQLSGGVRRLQESRDHALVVGFSMPLFASRQAEPAIAEAQAMRAQTDAEREAAFVRVRAQVYAIYQELLHAIGEVETLQRDVLPQMEKALEQTQYAYDRGRYSYLELVDGQRAFIESQRALIDAATNAHTFQIEIERLTAEPLGARPMNADPS